MPLARLNENSLYYAARRLDRRPVFLLIHGAGGSHLDWPPEMRRFEPYGTCAVDLPGHGRSSGPARSTISAYADDMLALAGELALTEVVLVGHSMGGAVALEIALREKENIVGLVLVATGARLRVNQQLTGLIDSDFASAVDLITTVAWGPDTPPGEIKRARQLMLTCDPAAVQMDFAACNDFDVMSRLGSVAIPTLVLVGAEDKMTPPKFGRYLADHIPQAEFASVPGAGHMLALEMADIVSGAIADFTQRRLTSR
jgi:pimeloyl-ACP methyl ester carboxylesterase